MGQIPCTRIQRLTHVREITKIKGITLISLTFSWIKTITLIHENIDTARYECKIL